MSAVDSWLEILENQQKDQPLYKSVQAYKMKVWLIARQVNRLTRDVWKPAKRTRFMNSFADPRQRAWRLRQTAIIYLSFTLKLFTANANIFTVLYKQLMIDANSFILRFSFAVNLMLNVESILNSSLVEEGWNVFNLWSIIEGVYFRIFNSSFQSSSSRLANFC